MFVEGDSFHRYMAYSNAPAPRTISNNRKVRQPGLLPPFLDQGCGIVRDNRLQWNMDWWPLCRRLDRRTREAGSFPYSGDGKRLVAGRALENVPCPRVIHLEVLIAMRAVDIHLRSIRGMVERVFNRYWNRLQ